MKSIYTLFFFTTILTSCAQNIDTIDYQIKISGKVDKAIGYSNNFELFKDNIGCSGLVKISTDVDSIGHFELIFYSEISQDISIGIAGHYEDLIVHPGDKIIINITENENKNILFKYSGSNALQNQFLSNFQIGYDSIINFDSINWNRKYYSGEQYKIYCHSIYKQLLDYKTKFFKINNLTDEYKNWIENEIVGNYYSWLIMYPNDHLLMNSLSWASYDLNYFDFLDSIPNISATDLINTNISKHLPNQLLGYYIRAIVDSRNNWNFETENRDSLIINEILHYSSKDNLFSQIMLSEYINLYLHELDTNLYSINLLLIDSFITNSYFNNKLKKEYTKAKQILESQKNGTSAKMIDWTENDVLSLIDSIKTKGENKIIYIDVWATWCGPCRSEMSSSYKLQYHFKDEPVDFVYICIDSEKKNWEDLISKFSLGGYHYFLTKKQSKILQEQLKINGIPYYLLFDKNGSQISSEDNLSPDIAKNEIQIRLD